MQDEILMLRKQERMRSLCSTRLIYVVADLGHNYGLDKLPEMLNDIRTKGVHSEYYKFSKAVIREMERAVATLFKF